MPFASIRIVTADLDALVAFYERVTGQQAERPAPVFAQFRGPARPSRSRARTPSRC